MKTKLKKVITLILTLAMVMSMGTFSALAADKDPGITVKGVETKATVQAYKIVKEVNGEWVKVNDQWGMTFIDKVQPYPTAEELQTIAKDFVGTDGIKLDESSTDPGTYTATKLDPGLYLILVTGGSYIYNPMMVGVDYDVKVDDDKNPINSILDLDNDDTGVAYAKKTEPKIVKEITGGATGGSKHGSSAQYGDVLDFKITTTIPSYGKEYTGATFVINDLLDKGLTLDESSVEINGVKASDLPDTTGVFATTKDKEGVVNGFDVTYKSDYILKNGGTKITVTYKAKVNDNATFNFDPNTNTATLKYTNTYKADGEPKTTTSKTYTYTFGFDANLTGEAIEGNIKTHEIIKLDENGDPTDVQKVTDSTDYFKFKNALNGAEFTLYTDEGCTKPATNAAGKEMKATTANNGYMEMKGLKEGTYYLKETSAPFGYTLNPNKITVEIKAEYYDDGQLKNYKILMNGTETGSYSIDQAGTKITNNTKEDATIYIKNTKIPGLPSTGGMGTCLFLIVGVTIMTIGMMRLGRKFKNSSVA